MRYRLELESRRLSLTINLRHAAARTLVYEAADTGLLGPELAAGIRRRIRERYAVFRSVHS